MLPNNQEISITIQVCNNPLALINTNFPGVSADKSLMPDFYGYYIYMLYKEFTRKMSEVNKFHSYILYTA